MSENKTIDVLTAKGKKSGSVELPGDVFDVATNVPLIHQVVVAQQAAARQGTHSTKTRGEVAGGGKKPWRQKGTGRARQGSTRSPQWVGGGTVFGPQPRSYAQRTPKKMVAAALRGALSDRARDGQIFVLASLVESDKPSTKAAKSVLSNLGDLKKVLVVLDRSDEISWLSVRNLAEVHVIAADQLNAYDVLKADQLVFTRAALAAFVGEDAAEAEVPETDEADLHPFGADSFRGDNPPEGFDIKGNESSMKFHTPESPWYGRTIAEVWFATTQAAEAAGFVNAVKSDKGSAAEEDAK
ncbi:MAG: 50S ribosomal protein L4 [Acidipropionibacterium acidipropionici]|jgi:large subunit ribosomal protein L4|uniref:Large ribosomal subunit protein uL4 n=2 Tax=Acidipropionibacterium acidipropionici TaxID=1748 RepID=A0A142KG51_9ACTN|nr:50S ribosomal protein L4 [Acidipropionibacterium acidipropionici]AFV90351.1 50S ribosomal protein L4 [Acidipropionibacterium acidipropionici ATCC 4875]ALN15406.1 50S ribosomal protein L4 [Acidipropionibacterium acidipropionici]AMS05089.1 50S ribosomal protein L4 [Acidipropionibacterium acidipropionici]AOZ46569.1 50S ribosomal protein L4 [Acidipropionibacterium acidipropionici]APZ08846.1 50S ribosomal protein L4 [Acidipropionibacterium acidipropionici]